MSHMRKLLLLALTAIVLSGCAPLLLAGGAVGGYAIAKNTTDQAPAKK